MKISPIPPIKGPHGYILKAEKDSPKITQGGAMTFYIDALYSTLVELQPKICLEIGTHRGGSAKTFQRYFDNYCNDGWLLTVDIKEYVDVRTDNVAQATVYPHVLNFKKHHKHVKDKDVLEGSEEVEGSEEKNCKIIEDYKSSAGIYEPFDFVFIDGDHQRDSFLKDVEIAKALSRPPHYMLLDDVSDYVHDSTTVFREEIKPKYDHYLFEDWRSSEDIFSLDHVNHDQKVVAGTALIWEKQ